MSPYTFDLSLYILSLSVVGALEILISTSSTQGKPIDNLTIRASSFKSQLDFGDLASGLYYMKFQVGEDVRILKMVKL